MLSLIQGRKDITLTGVSQQNQIRCSAGYALSKARLGVQLNFRVDP